MNDNYCCFSFINGCDQMMPSVRSCIWYVCSVACVLLADPVIAQLVSDEKANHNASADDRTVNRPELGTVGQRLFVDDAQRQQPFGELVGHHRRAVVG